MPLTVIGLTGLAVAATLLYRSNRDFRQKVEALTQDLERARDAFVHAIAENDALRAENDDQQAVIEAERDGRLRAEAREKVAQKRAKKAEAKAKAARQYAAREKALRIAAEERAAQEARRADEEETRRKEIEKENASLENELATESSRNLGNALASLKNLEEEMPVHAQDDDQDRRRIYLRHDCSVLRRLAYDFTDGRGDKRVAGARERRDELETRYEDACAEVR